MQKALFCGREKELSHLQNAWQKVIGEQKPQLVSLVAESGLGKTRLVQEFYAWLVKQSQDPATLKSYWPAKLNHEKNLIVNPDIDKVNHDMVMPFMWWALRLNNPNERNPTSSRAVNSHLEYLSPHLQAMYKARRIKKFQLESGIIATSLAASFIPVVSGIAEVASFVFDIFAIAKDVAQDRTLSPHEAYQDEIKDLNKRVVHDLGELLRENKKIASIPMVWVIDDAQFSTYDPGLVALFIDMLRTAQNESWPILILVTYWEQEWHLQYDNNKTPNVAHAIRLHYKMPFINKTWQPYELKNLVSDELAPILQAGLPGLTDEQSKALLARADGNPRFLEEIIKLCQGRERYFVKRDISQALKPDGFAEVLKISTELLNVVEERFNDIPKDVQGMISLSSLQGTSLLHLISQRTVDKLVAEGYELQDCNMPDVFDKAEKPYALINKFTKNYSEFSQQVFFEVAQAAIENYIDRKDAENALRQALKELFAERSGLSFSESEEELLLKLTAEILEQSQDSQEQDIALMVYLGLLKTAMAEYDYYTALEIAKIIVAGGPVKWQLEQINSLDLWYIYHAFRKMAEFDQALRIVSLMETKAINSGHKRNLGVAKSFIADIQKDQGKIEEALINYQASLKINQELAENYDTPETKRDLSISLNNVADVQKAQGKIEEALMNYQASLIINLELAENYDTPLTRRDLSVSLNNLADIQQTQGEIEEALKCYQASLKIRQELAENYDTPLTRRDLSVSFNKVADIQKARGEINEALINYQASLKIRQELAENYDTPETKRELSISLINVAHMQKARGEINEALINYQASLKIRQELAENYDTPETKRDLSISLNYVADIQKVQGEINEALINYQASLKIFQELAENNDTPEAKRDLSISLNNVADIQKAQGKIEDALMNYQASLKVFQELAENYDTPVTKRDLSFSLKNVADIQNAQGSIEEALKNYHASLEIAQELVENYNTPDSKRDLAVSYGRVGSVLEIKGELDAALESYQMSFNNFQEVLKILRTPQSKNDLSIAFQRLEDIKAKIKQQEVDMALKNLFASRQLYASLFTVESKRDLSSALYRAANILVEVNDLKEAESLFEEGLKINKELLKKQKTIDDSRNVALSYVDLADVTAKRGNKHKAKILLEDAMQAAKSYQKLMPGDDSNGIIEWINYQLDNLDAS